ncbi:MAG: M20 metallopeptidase family protein [Candidatus Marinamargulisbacteria bacterium]
MTVRQQFTPDLIDDLLTLRQTLHQHPELSNHEHQTQQTLVAELKKCNAVDIITPGTSVVARIKGQDESLPPVAIRGDIDALPIQEATGLPYASKNDGVMHACGHDVHATWAIGAARLLAQAPAKRDVIIILQQAEELATGAKFLLDEGALPSSIAAIFGAHVDRRYAVGQVVHHDGAISTYSDKFYFTVTGKSAHAARPKEGINPIPEAANLSTAIIDATTPLTNHTNLITITQVHGGSAHNIIPATVEVSGTIRCLDSSKRDAIKAALASLQGQRNGCEVTLRIDSASPAVLNDASLSTIAKNAIGMAVGNDGAVPLVAPNMASEDFGYYAHQFPGWFFRVGARLENEPFIPVHTPEFIAHDDAIFVGAAVLANAARLVG